MNPLLTLAIYWALHKLSFEKRNHRGTTNVFIWDPHSTWDFLCFKNNWNKVLFNFVLLKEIDDLRILKLVDNM